MKLTLGFSPCPNDTFIFDALVHQRIDTGNYSFDVQLADVEQLNTMAMGGKLDITKLSFHAYGYTSANYQLLYSGSALGKGCGPLLVTLSKHLNTDISELKIGIPGKFTTANFLLSLAYPNAKNKVDMLFSEIENALLRCEIDVGLIIHENRFTYQQLGLIKITDLGDYWENFAKEPIPLGAIAIKRNLTDKVKTDVNLLIRKSIEFAFKNPDASLPYSRLHAQNMNDHVMQQHIDLYVNEYSINLGLKGVKAINKLYDTAIGLGVLNTLHQPIFIKI